jgi:flagellar hook-basal body complex protein FliE
MKIDDQLMIVSKLPGAKSPAPKATGELFAKVLEKSVQETDQSLKTANQNLQDLASGRTNRLHETMMSLEEADISLKLFLQVRNKALEAYREIAKTQM